MFLAFLLLWMVPITVVVVSHNIYRPSHDGYFSAYFHDNEDYADSVQNVTYFLSILCHGYWSMLAGLSTGFADLMPVMFSLDTWKGFQTINVTLWKMYEERNEEQPISSIKGLRSPAMETEPNWKNTSQLSTIQSLIKQHFDLQRRVVLFNRAFSKHLMVTVCQPFFLCVVIFYSVIKLEFDHITTFLLYTSNLILSMLRAIVIFSIHGLVQCKLCLLIPSTDINSFDPLKPRPRKPKLFW